MRYLIAVAVITAALSAPAVAALPNAATFTSIDSVGRWIANYRAKPDPMRLPAMVRALSQIGAFKEPEAAGVYVGFIAGVIGANPGKAEDLINKMIAVAPAEHWVIVRAIAYSNHPDWKGLLRKFADRMPLRQVMIDTYLDGKLATLDEIPLEKKRLTLWDKVRGHFQREHDAKAPEEALEQSPELLDTLWGYYFATGSYRPIARIVSLLPWSNERDSVDKLTVGNMAKYTLASNAARDDDLLDMLRRGASASRRTSPRCSTKSSRRRRRCKLRACARTRSPASRSSSAKAPAPSATFRIGDRSARAPWRSAASPRLPPATSSSACPA